MFKSRNHNNTASFVKLKLAILKIVFMLGLMKDAAFLGADGQWMLRATKSSAIDINS